MYLYIYIPIKAFLVSSLRWYKKRSLGNHVETTKTSCVKKTLSPVCNNLQTIFSTLLDLRSSPWHTTDPSLQLFPSRRHSALKSSPHNMDRWFIILLFCMYEIYYYYGIIFHVYVTDKREIVYYHVPELAISTKFFLAFRTVCNLYRNMCLSLVCLSLMSVHFITNGVRQIIIYLSNTIQ